jgi:peptidyl-prolyl cis-trans isomerase SurA
MYARTLIVSVVSIAVMAVGSAMAQPVATTSPPASPVAGTPVAGKPTSKPSDKARPVYVVDRVVAVVNGAIVLESELAVQLLPYEDDLTGIADPKERARRKDKLRLQVLDEMIAEELIIEAADVARLEEISAKEIDEVLRETKEEHKLDDATFQQALSAQGYTLGQYRNNIRRQLTRLRAMKMLVASKITITDEEVQAQYDQMIQRAESVSQVRLAHIQFNLPERPTESEISAARAKAATAITRVKAGEDFAVVAGEMSDDEKTKASGGELGWIERGTLDPQWESVVFAMEPKDVRGPVSGPHGLHVFYVTENKRNEMKTFEQLKDQIRGELQQRAMQKQSQLWIDELRKKAYVEVKP